MSTTFLINFEVKLPTFASKINFLEVKLQKHEKMFTGMF